MADVAAFFSQNKELIAAVVAVLTFVVGVAAFVKSIIEYTRKNELERFEKYLELSKRWENDEGLQRIIFLFDTNDPDLKNIPYPVRHDFLGFYEEICLMHESGLLKTPVAYCMFGYYAIRCLESQNFWHGINKNAPAWYLFRRFANKMKEIEAGILAGAIKMDNWKFKF